MIQPALELVGVHVRRGDRPVLHSLDLALQAGDFTALVGPNGAGKTTLLQVVAGLLAPHAGDVRIQGLSLGTSCADARARLGFAVDPRQLPDLLTGRECLQLFARVRGLVSVPDSTGALTSMLALEEVLDRRVATYSLGMRQKLGIALGLLGEPPVLLLDEPLNGLDPRSAYALKRHLQSLCERGACVLLATHALEVAERFVNRALLLDDGRLARDWSRQELQALRDDPSTSLEQAMAEAMR